MRHWTSVVATLVGAGLLVMLPAAHRAEAQELPAITVDPPSGPPGTFIEFTGSGFTDPTWSVDGAQVWFVLEISDECELVLGLDNAQFALSDDGILSGSGNVGTVGSCKQSEGTQQPVAAGTYAMSYRCYACTVGQFTVTGSASTSTPKSLPHTGPRENQLSAMLAAGVVFLLVGTTLLSVTRPVDREPDVP